MQLVLKSLALTVANPVKCGKRFAMLLRQIFWFRRFPKPASLIKFANNEAFAGPAWDEPCFGIVFHSGHRRAKYDL